MVKHVAGIHASFLLAMPIGAPSTIGIRMRLLVITIFTALILPTSARSECKVAPQPQLETAPVEIETSAGKHLFIVELAVTGQQRTCGLMMRKQLDPHSGMLFKQPSIGPAWFWMKNTPQPLDMLFLDKGGRVLMLAKHTIPYSKNPYGTSGNVAAVLEVTAGTASRLSIKIGDRIVFNWFEEK
jgi:uncharacterized membrane protein (UPF0127 family)